MSAVVCTCPRSRLCATCLDQALLWHRGKAAARGYSWAEDVARRRPELLARPWPDTDRARELAAAKVADFGEDPRVRAALVAEVMVSAARRWE